MNDLTLFQLALGLENPWFVSSSTFDVDQKRLDIRIDFNGSSRNKRARNPCNLLRYYFLRDFDIFFLVTTST
jgi:hypothetical protein